MGGPRITLIRPLILSDPLPGMSQGGRPGINSIHTTGSILNKSILITAGTMLVRRMTRISIMPTIVARGEAGIRDSMASVLLAPVLLLMCVVAPVLLLMCVVGPVLLLMCVVDLVLSKAAMPLEPLLQP